ncbi:hypothetical protein J4E08_11405 [Sagittula sp. NFXS13]|uniref:hypothetical protein n=1 Tax=Sagittula sp. NFXS13 TaxID=2819095 RepID=UPI0032DE54FA
MAQCAGQKIESFFLHVVTSTMICRHRFAFHLGFTGRSWEQSKNSKGAETSFKSWSRHLSNVLLLVVDGGWSIPTRRIGISIDTDDPGVDTDFTLKYRSDDKGFDGTEVWRIAEPPPGAVGWPDVFRSL